MTSSAPYIPIQNKTIVSNSTYDIAQPTTTPVSVPYGPIQNTSLVSNTSAVPAPHSPVQNTTLISNSSSVSVSPNCTYSSNSTSSTIAMSSPSGYFFNNFTSVRSSSTLATETSADDNPTTTSARSVTQQ
ncbi:hypothetical protein DL95DRAFT_378013, partial [Leptodontidium sp. 2 PMI_412]